MNLHSLRIRKTALATALCAAACSQLGLAQLAPPTILQIDMADHVIYVADTADPLKYATDPSIPTRAAVRNFYPAVHLADIASVNGQPVKGSLASVGYVVALRPAPDPGFAIADTHRNAVSTVTLEILKSDGTPIGTIVASGLLSGPPPPGSPVPPSTVLTGGHNFAITGGTGAFLGVRGQLGAAPPVARQASTTEDPMNRRRHGGGPGTWRWIAHLIPMARPEVTMLPSGPAITHSSDFTPVSAAKPAAAGETLSLFATGLGPVNPRVDPGQPFPASPLAAVNSPVSVTVNGKEAEVLGAVGYPGAVDAYQVNFKLPDDTPKGTASVQVTAAWVSGVPVSLPVQ